MKSSHHKTAITIFGVVIPFVFISALIGATLYGRGKLSQTHADKVSNLERFKMARIHADGIEATLATGQKREEIAYWRSKIETDFIQSITDNLEKTRGKINKRKTKVHKFLLNFSDRPPFTRSFLRV